jgi:tetratricopeptide (TPR) repeat protein
VTSSGALPAAAPRDDGHQRRVAVLIMVVTLLGAIFAFLHTLASNRSAAATRSSDEAAVEAMGALARGAGSIAEENQVFVLANEDATLAVSLAAWGGSAGADASAWGQGFLAMHDALLPYSDLSQPAYQNPDGSVNWSRFVDGTLSPSYTAAEYQKAYAAQRDGWGSKAGVCVTVVTVLAVSLFLLGLSRTSVAAASGGLLAGVGTGLALVATLWGVAVFARPVEGPSPQAIAAFVEGGALFDAAQGVGDLQQAEAAFTRAIEARPDYVDAYMGRGTTRFRLDLLADGGPVGSVGARDDFAHALALDRLNSVAWGDLGAARFWLGDLRGAGEATRRALALDPDDLTFNLNLGLFLALSDGEAAYESQVARIATLAAGSDVPTWLRRTIFDQAATVLGLIEEYRLEYAATTAAYQERLTRIDHQIEVSKRFFGTATPAPVAAQVGLPSFALSDDGTRLVATWSVTGMAEGERWLWRTYLGGVEDADLSSEPQVWSFGIPDDTLTITLDQPGGFAAGVPVRVEVFVEGNLLQAGEFTPFG